MDDGDSRWLDGFDNRPASGPAGVHMEPRPQPSDPRGDVQNSSKGRAREETLKEATSFLGAIARRLPATGAASIILLTFIIRTGACVTG